MPPGIGRVHLMVCERLLSLVEYSWGERESNRVTFGSTVGSSSAVVELLRAERRVAQRDEAPAPLARSPE